MMDGAVSINDSSLLEVRSVLVPALHSYKSPALPTDKEKTLAYERVFE
jgi:hypothetical protein